MHFRYLAATTYYRSVVLIFLCFVQTIAVNKRNAGLPSAVPRATLNDEELVRILLIYLCSIKRSQKAKGP